MLSSGIFKKCAICDIRIRVNVYDTRFTFVPPYLPNYSPGIKVSFYTPLTTAEDLMMQNSTFDKLKT